MNNIKKITQKDRYGAMISYEFNVPSLNEVPKPDHPGDPKGTDTVPAWLTPGENVVNAEASRLPGNQQKIDQMNDQGRSIQKQQGGPIPSYQADKGKYIGQPTGRQTIVGRDIYSSPMTGPMGNLVGGKNASEQGATIKRGDQYGNIPSIYNGMQYNEDQLLQMMKNKNINMPNAYYDNPITATEASKMRSRALDGQNVMGMEHTQPRYQASGGQVPEYASAGSDLRDYLKSVEGVRNNAYQDSGGNYTVGVGNTDNVNANTTLNNNQVDERLNQDIAVVENDYNNLVDIKLNDNQANSVKSLLFNIGGPNFAKSKARAALNSSDFETYKKEMLEFRLANGEVIPGLENRRASELALFDMPTVTYDETPIKPGMFSAMASTNSNVVNDQNPEDVQAMRDRLKGVVNTGEIPVVENEIPAVEGPSSPSETLAKLRSNVARSPEEIAKAVYDNTAIKTGMLGAEASGNNAKVPPIDRGGSVINAVPDLGILEKLKNIPGDLYSGYQEFVESGIPYVNDLEKMTLENLQTGKVELLDGTKVDSTFYGLNTSWLNSIEDNIKIYKDQFKANPTQRNKDLLEAEKKKSKDITDRLKVISTEKKAALKVQDDKKKELEKYDPDSGIVDDKQQEKNNTILDFISKLPKDENKVIDNKEVEKKIPEVDPTVADQVGGWFTDMFKDMFSGPELARMALTYSASRLLGYDHGNSFEHSAKQYMTRVDSDIAARQAFVTKKDNLKEFTTKSLAKYRASGDLNDLKRIKTGTSVIGPGPMITHNKFGPLPTKKIGKDKFVIQYKGQLYPYDDPIMAGQTRPYDKELDEPQAVQDLFYKRGGELIKALNRDIPASDEKTPRITEDAAIQAQIAADRYIQDVQLYGSSPLIRSKLRTQMLQAQDEFWKEYKKSQRTGGDVPKSVLSFYNKRAITPKTEGVVSQNDFIGATAERVSLLDETITNISYSAKDNAKRYRELWGALKQNWSKYGSKDRQWKDRMSNTGDATGNNSFTYWASKVLENNPKPSDEHKAAIKLMKEKYKPKE